MQWQELQALLAYLMIRLSLGALVGCLIPAVIFRVILKQNERLDLSFEASYTTMLIGYLVTALIAVPLFILLTLQMRASELTFYLFFVPLLVIVLAVVISRRHRLPLASGVKLSALLCGVLFVLGVLSVGAFVLFTGGSQQPRPLDR